MSEHKNIPGQPAVPPQEEILNYLSKDMPDTEQHEFERAANEDDFMNDAMEGLETLNTKTNLAVLTDQLNTDLKKKLEKKNKRKEKRKFVDQPWIYFAVILVVLLILAAFIVMRQFG